MNCWSCTGYEFSRLDENSDCLGFCRNKKSLKSGTEVYDTESCSELKSVADKYKDNVGDKKRVTANKES